MKKKILSLCLVVALAATAIVGASMAYLTDEDSDVNVMTLGNVKIKQHEYQRAETEGGYTTKEIDGVTSYVLEAFEQDKALLPTTESTNYGAGPWDETTVRMSQVASHGGMQVFTSKNAVDKFVTVENTGKTDAYVRTLVAFEIGSTDGSLIGISNHKAWSYKYVGTITIDSNNYDLVEFVYRGIEGAEHENGILPAGDTSYPNLAQVYLSKDATNEDCAALDGNGNGTLDIIVISQAVQAAGFADAQTALDTAFGTVAENAATWFKGKVGDAFAVYSADDNSLTFYRAYNLPEVDSIYENKTVTAVYTGVESTVFSFDGAKIYPGWVDGEYQKVIKTVDFQTTVQPISTASFFDGMSALETITNIDRLDVSKVTNMGYMFNGCSSLTSLDLSSFNTANVTKMAGMFYGCEKLTVDCSTWDVSSVIHSNNSYACAGCSFFDWFTDSVTAPNFSTTNHN